MMLVASRIGPSAIQGIGVFAEVPIAAGQLVWRLDSELDRVLPTQLIPTLPAAQQAFLNRYAYFDRELQAFVLCCDDARFMNHSEVPNVSPVIRCVCVALQAIVPGDELTCDYRQLDPRPMLFPVK
jgi:hypothetical protein